MDSCTLQNRLAGLPIGTLKDETILSDLTTALDAARTDEKIAGLRLRLDNLDTACSAAAGELAEVFPAGYGSRRPYYAEGLKKIGGQPRLFRSGDSKSAAEGSMRSGKYPLQTYLDIQRPPGDSWSEWLRTVSGNRGIPRDVLSGWINTRDDKGHP